MKIMEIKDIKFFAKGHRGILYKGLYKNKLVVIKKKLPTSRAIGRIENEARWLRIVNKYNIGPKSLFIGKDYFVYDYIPGDFILDFIKELESNKKNKSIVIRIIKDIFNQLFILDMLKVDKEEMHHPVKHIIINKNKAFLIDFERCHKVKKGKNITQFCDFLISKHVSKLLKEEGIKINRKKMINLAKKYKRNENKKNLNKILKNIK